MRKQLFPIISFIITTYLLTWLLICNNNPLSETLAQASPAFAAILAVIIFKYRKRNFSQLGLLKLGSARWYLLAILLPFLAIASAYVGAQFFGLVYFHPWHGLLPYASFLRWFPLFFGKYIIYIFIWPLLWAMAEEIGWRGFLQPRLTQLVSLPVALTITGLVWVLWHYFFIFCGNYYDAGNTALNTLLFSVTVFLMSFTLGWIRHASKSLWPCIIFHSASNAAWQMWSYQFNTVRPTAIYFTGEAGVFNIIFWAICFIIVIKKINLIK